jgi:hypothetical protein
LLERHGAADLLQRQDGDCTNSQDDIGRERDQFRREFANTFGIARAPTVFDRRVLAVGPALLLQPLQERCDACHGLRIVSGQVHKHADAPHPLGLLGARRERPRGCRAAPPRRGHG